MLSYIVGLLAIVGLYNPLMRMLAPGPPTIGRTPRPTLREELLALETVNRTGRPECPSHEYSVHIFSREPLVLYIENFLAVDERSHLLEIR